MEREWELRPGLPADAEWLADLKARTMRPDLERLGLWDEDWARRRFLETYIPANTVIIEVAEKPVGVIAVRFGPEALWIEHFYLDPAAQGRGLGRQVLQHVMDAHRDCRPFRLAIDRGSAARRLYERVGFVYLYDDDNGVDQIFGAPGDASAP
jgi:GNAT superfamily N-acetyltransferase